MSVGHCFNISIRLIFTLPPTELGIMHYTVTFPENNVMYYFLNVCNSIIVTVNKIALLKLQTNIS